MPRKLGQRLLVYGASSLAWVALCVGCASKEQAQTPADYMRLGDRELGRKREAQARQYYEQVLTQYPESDLKAQAQLNIAEALYREQNYLEARFEYQKFLELYPLHPLASQAQFQLGMCSLQTVQSFDRAQQHTRAALQAFRQFRAKYPQDPLVVTAEEHMQFLRQRLADHELAVARFYYRKGAYQATISRCLNLIQVYPEMPEIDAVFYMLAESYRAEENYVKARSVLQTLATQFPSSKYLAQARTALQRLPHTGIATQ